MHPRDGMTDAASIMHSVIVGGYILGLFFPATHSTCERSVAKGTPHKHQICRIGLTTRWRWASPRVRFQGGGGLLLSLWSFPNLLT